MMTSSHVRGLLDARPFRPFKFCLTDGTSYSVPHPEFAWVWGSLAYVGQAGGSGPGPRSKVSQIALLHVARVELEEPKASG
jgi:hypothetical protein